MGAARKLTLDEAAICFKLVRNKVIGKHHMLEDNLLNGFPSHKLGDMRDALDALKRDQLVMRKKSKHGEAVYLDPSLVKPLTKRIKEHKDFGWLPE